MVVGEAAKERNLGTALARSLLQVAGSILFEAGRDFPRHRLAGLRDIHDASQCPLVRFRQGAQGKLVKKYGQHHATNATVEIFEGMNPLKSPVHQSKKRRYLGQIVIIHMSQTPS